jgi:hypothetical protein
MTREDVMKSKAKPVKRARKSIPKKPARQKKALTKRAQPQKDLSLEQKEILKRPGRGSRALPNS